MVSEAQKRAKAKYDKAHSRQILIRFYDSDADIYDWLQEHSRKGAWIKSLIREAYEKESKG